MKPPCLFILRKKDIARSVFHGSVEPLFGACLFCGSVEPRCVDFLSPIDFEKNRARKISEIEIFRIAKIPIGKKSKLQECKTRFARSRIERLFGADSLRKFKPAESLLKGRARRRCFPFGARYPLPWPCSYLWYTRPTPGLSRGEHQ